MRFSKYFKNWSEQYYANAVEIGKNGDFYTAVSVGELFGFLCAKRFIKLVEDKQISLPVDIVEIGANNGIFLNDFARYLSNKRPDIFDKVKLFIIEPHEKLRKLQKENIAFDFIHTNLAEFKSKNAFFLANELFDAFACELYENGKIAYVKNGKICFDKCNESFSYIERFCPQRCEFSPEIYEFLKYLKQNCERFYFLSFDYFNLVPNFSLRIYKKHEIIDAFMVDLDKYFAKSDITWSVNYEEFSYYLETLGLAHKLTRQASALFSFGIDEFSEPKYANMIKHLCFGFSENFYCLEFYKN